MRKTILLTIFVALVTSASAFAQATAAINGRVVDQGGAVLPGATILVTNTATGVTRDTLTNGEGLYSIPALNPGTYDVQAEISGFAPAVKKSIELLTGSNLTIAFELGVAAIRESVEVRGAAPLIETTQSVASSSIRQTEVEQLPMLNRSLAAMITLLPGAREVPGSTALAHGHASTYVSFGGGSGRNFNMLVDGVDNKDDHDGGTAMVFSLEGVQEFKAFTSGFTAEYGKGAATIVLATKSGTNRVQGSVFGYGRNESLIANDYFSKPENGGQGKQPFSRMQYGGSIGGPILKDRAFYFASIERVQQNFILPRPDNLYRELLYLEPLHIDAVASHAISQPFRDLMSQVKVNYQLSRAHALFVRYASQVGYVDNANVSTGRALLACCDVAAKNRQVMWNASTGWTWILNPTTVNQFSTQFLYYHHDEEYASCNSVACLSQRLNFPSVSSGVQNAFPDWHNRENKIEIKDDFSKQLASHSLKVGVDYVALPLYGGVNGYSSPGSITFFDDPSVIVNNSNGRYPLGFLTPGIVRSITVTPGTAPSFDALNAWSFGIYAQDDFRLTRRLTLNVGVRYDVYEFMDQPELDKNRTYLILKAIGNPSGKLPRTDTNNVAPRLGLAWDLGGDGKNVLRAGFGMFFGQGNMNSYILPIIQSKPNTYFTQTLANSAIGVGQLATFVYGQSPLPTAPAAPTDFPVGQNVGGSAYSPDLKDSLARQSHIGLSHLFPRESVLSVDYTHIRGLNGWRTLNINPLLPNPDNPGGPRIRPLAAETLRVFGDGNLLGPTSIVASVNQSLYDELAVHFERRFSQRAAFQTNYTLAWARGMGGSTDGTTGGTIYPPQTPSATGGDIYAPWETGPTAYDERHRVTVAGVFSLPFDIDVSPSFTAASARPYSQFRATNPSGDGNLQLLGSDGNPVGINNARGKALVNANARLTRNVTLSENRKLAVFAEFYNILNRANFGNSYNGNAFAPATYNQANGYLGGVASTSTIPNSFQVQFGARLSF